jgi:hypothetical protein
MERQRFVFKRIRILGIWDFGFGISNLMQSKIRNPKSKIRKMVSGPE